MRIGRIGNSSTNPDSDHPDRKGDEAMSLTRADMEQVLKSGQSVMYKGQLITDVGSLPSEEELATNAGANREALADNLQGQIDMLQRRKDALLSAPTISQLRAPQTDTKLPPAGLPGAAGEGAGQQAGGEEDGLPTELPMDCVSILIQANVKTRSALAALSDAELRLIPGIGEGRIKQIHKALGRPE
jgi:hypothetical protein